MNRKGAPLVENIQIFCGRNSMKFFVELIRDFSVGIETKEKASEEIPTKKSAERDVGRTIPLN